MKKYKQYLSWLNWKQKQTEPGHSTDHGEETLRDPGVPLEVSIAALKESSAKMSGTIDQYRDKKVDEAEFKKQLRELKWNASIVLMKIETGW